MSAESIRNLIFYQLPSGTVVKPRIIHTILTGITQHGKTEVIKSLIPYYQSQGYTVLIIDVKDKTIGKPDFAEYLQIPIYLEEITDPLSLLGLLESNAKMKLKFQFPELIKACQRATTLRGIRDELDEVITGGKIHPVRKDKAEVLKLVLDSLIEEIDRIHKSETLQIKKGQVNCMNLSNQGFSDAFKQIAVRSVVRYVRMNLSKIFIVFDEAHIQVPEGYSSASKQWIVKTIKEGASSKQFLLIADQTIKEVDKNVVSQCHFKIFGGQAGGQLEAKRTYDYMPVKKDVSIQSIMRLSLGHFYLCTRDWTKLCYALPRRVPAEIGVKVAKGELTPEYVRDKFMLKIEKKGADEEVYKKKFEDLQKEFEKFREETGKEVSFLHERVKVAEDKWLDAQDQLQGYEAFADLVKRLAGTQAFAESRQGQKVKLESSMTEISVEDTSPKEVLMTTDKPAGKIMFCAVKLHERILKINEGTFPPVEPMFTSADLQKEASEYGWKMGNRQIGGIIMVLIRDGHLIKENKHYRLPSEVKINVNETKDNESM